MTSAAALLEASKSLYVKTDSVLGRRLPAPTLSPFSDRELWTRVPVSLVCRQRSEERPRPRSHSRPSAFTPVSPKARDPFTPLHNATADFYRKSKVYQSTPDLIASLPTPPVAPRAKKTPPPPLPPKPVLKMSQSLTESALLRTASRSQSHSQSDNQAAEYRATTARILKDSPAGSQTVELRASAEKENPRPEFKRASFFDTMGLDRTVLAGVLGADCGSVLTSAPSNVTRSVEEVEESDGGESKKPLSIIHKNARVIRWIHDCGP